MELNEALGWLNRRLNHELQSRKSISAGQTSGLSLEPMRELMSLLGDPQDTMPAIHITGTNGKGSVALLSSSLITNNGLTAGAYVSPHIERLNERILRDREPIDDQELAELFSVLASIEPMLSHEPSWFEAMTAAAFLFFADAPVDAAVIEVGLLGRFDATNVIDANVCVVTSIGNDHTDGQPGWEQQIATEKAGIIHAGATTVLGDIHPELHPTFAAEGPEKLLIFGTDFGVEHPEIAHGGYSADFWTPYGRYPDVFVGIHGRHQLTNAAIALTATSALFESALSDEVVHASFEDPALPGRCEVLSHQPLVMLDSAHNPDALLALGETFTEEFNTLGSRIVIYSTLNSHSQQDSLAAIKDLNPDVVFITSVPSPNGVDPDSADPAQVGAIAESIGLHVEVFHDFHETMQRVLNFSTPEDSIVVTGTHRSLGAARQIHANWHAEQIQEPDDLGLL